MNPGSKEPETRRKLRKILFEPLANPRESTWNCRGDSVARNTRSFPQDEAQRSLAGARHRRTNSIRATLLIAAS
jgi:hypothetical protein